jgi:ureidoglycolate lyase
VVLVATAITPEGYRPYGDVLSADRHDIAARPANQGTAARKDGQIVLAHDRPAARANFASFRCTPRTEWPMLISLLEKHPRSTQVFVPMKGEAFVVVVALGGDAPDLTTLRAFIAGKGVAISYRPGVWHHPMIALDEETDFACLIWEDGTADDAIEYDLTSASIVMARPGRG